MNNRWTAQTWKCCPEKWNAVLVDSVPAIHRPMDERDSTISNTNKCVFAQESQIGGREPVVCQTQNIPPPPHTCRHNRQCATHTFDLSGFECICYLRWQYYIVLPILMSKQNVSMTKLSDSIENTVALWVCVCVAGELTHADSRPLLLTMSSLLSSETNVVHT